MWVRTALALMAFGIAVDRFALLLRHSETNETVSEAHLPALSTLGGAALVAFGVAMAVISGIRYLLYVRQWQRSHELLPWHGPYMAFSFAMLTAAFGIGLLFIMLLLT